MKTGWKPTSERNVSEDDDDDTLTDSDSEQNLDLKTSGYKNELQTHLGGMKSSGQIPHSSKAKVNTFDDMNGRNIFLFTGTGKQDSPTRDELQLNSSLRNLQVGGPSASTPALIVKKTKNLTKQEKKPKKLKPPSLAPQRNGNLTQFIDSDSESSDESDSDSGKIKKFTPPVPPPPLLVKKRNPTNSTSKSQKLSPVAPVPVPKSLNKTELTTTSKSFSDSDSEDSSESDDSLPPPLKSSTHPKSQSSSLTIQLSNPIQIQFFEGCLNGELKLIQDIIKNISNFDYNFHDDQGVTPLHAACIRGHLPIVKWLIEDQNHCVYISCRDFEGMTPLHFASENGYGEICVYLVSQLSITSILILSLSLSLSLSLCLSLSLSLCLCLSLSVSLCLSLSLSLSLSSP
jgi:hypothetical protein